MDALTHRHPAAVPGRAAGPLDHYLLFGTAEEANRGGTPEGLLVEEFRYRADHTAAARDSAGWTAQGGTWWSSAAFSRAVRADPDLRRRVVPVDQVTAVTAYRLMGGGELPGPARLRERFTDREHLPGAAPLRLGPPDAPPGFRERRVYRILCTPDLDGTATAALTARWGLAPGGDPGVIGRAALTTGGHAVEWVLRRIASGAAYGVDVTVRLGEGGDHGVGELLRELRETARRYGLLTVTVERFA